MEKKGKKKGKMTFFSLIVKKKNDMPIEKATKSMISDRIEWWKKNTFCLSDEVKRCIKRIV